MTEKSVREKSKEQNELMELDEEYGRITENEMIYSDEVSRWQKLKRIITPIQLILFVLAIVSMFSLPSGTQLSFETFQQYALQYSAFFSFVSYAPIAMILYTLLLRKIRTIKNELGLHKEESLYLRAYETHSNIESYIKEDKPKRKIYFKKISLRSAKELVDVVSGWKYGNVRLVSNLVGQQIDLLKDNMKRLVVSNVAKGDESSLRKASEILVEFCKYLGSPSIEGLEKLNESMKELPFREYKFLTKGERFRGYLYGKPRFFRLLFAGGVTAISMAILWCLNLNLAIIVAVAFPCFWGAFTGFDKLFGLKE